MPAPDLLAGRARRRALFFFLYVCEGAPFGFIWWMLPVLLREAGTPVERITLATSLATLPWTLKFLAAPLVDFSSARGVPLRYWIAAMQLGMFAALLPLLGLDLGSGFALLLPCLLAHSALAAVQDVAVDTLAMRSVPAGELGALNGWMQAGMLAGRAATAGLGLTLAERYGIDAVVLVLGGLLAASAVTMLFVLRNEPAPVRHRPAELFAELGTVAAGALFWLAAAFALTGGTAFEAFGALAGPLFTDLGYPRSTIAGIFAVTSPLAMVAGALAGGALADRLGRIPICAGTVVLLAIAVATFAALPAQQPGPLWQAGLALYYLFVGMFTAVSYSLFMQLSAPSIMAATHFSVLMALTNACEVWSGFVGGRLAGALGYGDALRVMAALSLLALPALAYLARRSTRAPGPRGSST